MDGEHPLRDRRLTLEPRLLTKSQAARYLGLSPEGFAREIFLKPIKVGNKELWDRYGLDVWVDFEMGRIQPNLEPLLLEKQRREERLGSYGDRIERSRRREALRKKPRPD